MQSEYKKMKRLPEEEKMSFKNRKTAQSGLRSHMRNSVREAFRAQREVRWSLLRLPAERMHMSARKE